MKKVLVVEDDIKMRKILVDELKKQGFSTIEAGNGQDGLDLALKEKPDLILLDLIMPVMDGLEMLNRLRAEKEGQKVQVIILTNSGDFGKIAEAVEKGICSYIVKSDITTDDLVKKVGDFLN
jgi:DNA-binding response OmpR family regulator